MTPPTMADLIRAASEHSDVAVNHLEDRVRKLEGQVGVDAPLAAEAHKTVEARVRDLERGQSVRGWEFMILFGMAVASCAHMCNDTRHVRPMQSAQPALAPAPAPTAERVP